jgi:hypothetical protein
LEFDVDAKGALTGQLLGEPVEGFISGRRIVIRRSADGQAELWEGWLARPSEADRIVAGTISVTNAGQTQVYPWFGTIGTAVSAPSSIAPSMPVAPVAAAPPPDSDPRQSSGGGVSGAWSADGDDRVEIDLQGNQLTVTLADGSAASGRMTGPSSFVVGLGKGCCSGTLETPDVIVWSDGARWRRAD